MSKVTRPTTHAKLPSNARVRRAAHKERDAAVKARKRKRIARGQDDAIRRLPTTTLKFVDNLVDVGLLKTVDTYDVQIARESERVGTTIRQSSATPFRATAKTDAGWPVVDSAGTIVTHAASRDKARKIAREGNEVGGIAETVVV